ncbi:MAG: zinc finger domain-containing protein [Nostoc sp.]
MELLDSANALQKLKYTAQTEDWVIGVVNADLTIHRYLENLSLNLSPTRRETLNFPPSRVGKGARGLGLSWAFPHDVKSQNADGEKCVGKAYTKCDRCWNYSTRMGESAEHPLICDRCLPP